MRRWVRKCVGIACLSILAPMAAQSAEFKITPRQQKILDAMREGESLMRVWDEPRFKYGMQEAEFRRMTMLMRCGRWSKADRLFAPAYRRYVDTVGAAYYRHVRSSPAAAAFGRKHELWAIDQLNEAQYQRSLDWLARPDAADARAVREVGLALGDAMRNLIDVSEGVANVPFLVAFKQALADTGQVAPVAAAIKRVDPDMAAIFESVDSTLPVPDAVERKWADLAGWMMGKASARIEEAYWQGIPEPTLTELAELLNDPFIVNLDRAQEAMAAWRDKKQGHIVAEIDVAGLTDVERLGRQIDFYFGDPDAEESDEVLLETFNWQRKEAAAYIKANRAELCGTP